MDAWDTRMPFKPLDHQPINMVTQSSKLLWMQDKFAVVCNKKISQTFNDLNTNLNGNIILMVRIAIKNNFGYFFCLFY